MAGSNETKAISAFNLKLKLKLTEAELGNKDVCKKTRAPSPGIGFDFLDLRFHE